MSCDRAAGLPGSGIQLSLATAAMTSPASETTAAAEKAGTSVQVAVSGVHWRTSPSWSACWPWDWAAAGPVVCAGPLALDWTPAVKATEGSSASPSSHATTRVQAEVRRVTVPP